MASYTDGNSCPSAESSDSGSGQAWSSSPGSWDSEDEEIVAEIREVWRMSAVSFSAAEESSDSLDAEEIAQIKSKLRALREYVTDLQANYDELLALFSQHEASANDCRLALEKKLQEALSRAKDYQDQCRILENKLSAFQHDKLGNSTCPKSPVGQELADDLHLISAGLESRVKILSQLNHTNLSPTDCKSLFQGEEDEDNECPLPQNAQQSSELKNMKVSVTQQVEEQGVADQTITDWELEGINEDSVLGQLLEKECEVTVLQTRVQDLEQQLQEAQRDHRQMATSLVQEDHKDENYMSLKSELSEMRAERNKLAAEVAESYRSVNDLQKQLDDMKQKMSTHVRNFHEKGDLSSEGSDQTGSDTREVSMCEADRDRAHLQEKQQQLSQRCLTAEETVCALEKKLRTVEEESQILQSEALRNKKEMNRLVSSVQLAQAQIATMHMRMEQPSGSQNIKKDFESYGEQTNAAEKTSVALNECMTQHKSLWEQLCDCVDSHQASVTAMQNKHAELVAEVNEREARVLELEALLQAGDVSSASGRRSLRDVLLLVGLLKGDLAKAKEEQLQSKKQYADLLNVMEDSLNVIFADRSMLHSAIADRDEQLCKLQCEYRELSELYSATCAQASSAESEKQLADQQLREANHELRKHRLLVADLEADLLGERKAREVDMELTTVSLYSLRDQLASVALMTSDGSKAGLQDQLNQRDALLATLQEQTAQLLLQYQQSSEEVDERQRLVRDLETDLLSSQALCDSLQQEITDGQLKADKLQQELMKSEANRVQLAEQLQRLQKEAEDACNELERSLRQNKLLTQQSQDHVESLELQLSAEREVSNQLNEQIQSLKQSQFEGDRELQHVRLVADDLREENTRLRSRDQQQEETIVNLHAQLQILEERDANISHERNAEIVVRKLKQQLAASEKGRMAAEEKALERLNDIVSLKTQIEEANHTITDMKVERLGLTHSSQDHHQRIVELEETISSLNLQMKKKEKELLYQRSTGDENTAFIQQKLDECREELHRCQLRASELDAKYQSTLDELADTKAQLNLHSLDSHFSSMNQDENTHHLKSQVQNYQQELERKDHKLRTSERERMELLLCIGELEQSAPQGLHSDVGSSPPSVSGGADSSTSSGAYQSTELNLPSSYRQTLEKGLACGSVLDTSGYSSPVGSPDELDKAYWIRRAAELSVQLQQSTQYWTAKVKEQDLQLHSTF